MRKTRAQRRAAKRKRVDRTERIKPPPEAAQHRRDWPLQTLLALGPEADGIDSDEFEAAVELVETYRALTAELQARGAQIEALPVHTATRGMSDSVARMCAVWFAWSEFVGPVATHIVEQIEDEMPIRSVAILRAGLRHWLRLKPAVLQNLDNTPGFRLTMFGPTNMRRGQVDAYSTADASPAARAHRAAPQTTIRPTAALKR